MSLFLGNDHYTGFIAITSTDDQKWGIHASVDLDHEGYSTNYSKHTTQPIFISNTFQEAKRKVDMLIGCDSGEIPLFDADPK